MVYTFPTDQYNAVRAAIGLDVDAGMLPDATLALSIYTGEVERYIMRSLTEAEYTNSIWLPIVNNAAILYLASLVTPRLRIVTSERIAGGNLTYAAIDQELIAQRLLRQANEQLALIQAALGLPPQVKNPVYFGLAHRILNY